MEQHKHTKNLIVIEISSEMKNDLKTKRKIGMFFVLENLKLKEENFNYFLFFNKLFFYC